MNRNNIFVALFIAACFCSCGAQKTIIEKKDNHFPASTIMKTVGNIDVMVDPNVEMMNVIYRISGIQPDYVNAKEAHPLYTSYLSSVDEYFDLFKYSPAVQALQINRMTYTRPSEFGMYLNSNDSDFTLKPNNKYFVVSDGLAKDIPYYKFSTVREAVREFRTETNFDRFFLSNITVYNELIDKHIQLLTNSNIDSWLEEFYGIKFKENLCLYITKLSGNYGISFVGPKGIIPHAVVLDQPSVEGSLFLISHEFSHPMTRKIVDELYMDKKISGVFDKLYNKNAAFYNSNGYTNGFYVLNETINQACANKYLETIFPEDVMNKIYTVVEFNKMIYVSAITKYLDNYENNRSKYKNLKTFNQELKKFLVTLE
jgi:hypothetical protein